jgi:hypothetical protein
VIVAAAMPTLRLAHLGWVAMALVAGCLPVAVTVGRGGSDPRIGLVIACVVAGAVAGFAVDDTAAEALGPSPVGAPARLVLRLAAVSTLVAAAMALMVIFVWVGPGLPRDLPDRVPEALTAAAAALSVGLVATRRGERSVGPLAVMSGAVVTALVGALAMRWPAVLPAFAAGPQHSRWWWLAALGAAIALHAGRDPGRR